MTDYFTLKALPCCPPGITEIVRYRQDESDAGKMGAVDKEMLRICCFPEMIPVWKSLIEQAPNNTVLCNTAFILNSKFIQEERSRFELMTNPVRLKWLTETRATLAKLVNLMEEAPPDLNTSPLLGSPDYLMRFFLDRVRNRKRIPTEVPASDITDAILHLEMGYSSLYSTHSPDWGLRDIAKRVLGELSRGVPNSITLSKTRDPKSVRASYILYITRALETNLNCHLTDDLVATVTRVVFEEESTTASIANKFRYRDDKNRFIGGIQHSSENAEKAG